eukprot:9495503-Pyramimonas_sp.AAC.2
MADQSEAGRAGMFSRRTNQRQDAQVCSHGEPIRRRKRGYILGLPVIRFFGVPSSRSTVASSGRGRSDWRGSPEI